MEILHDWHVINMALKSYDAFDTVEEVEEHIEHFLDDGYKKSDLYIFYGTKESFSPILMSARIGG
jgi:hypothetical protein